MDEKMETRKTRGAWVVTVKGATKKEGIPGTSSDQQIEHTDDSKEEKKEDEE